MDPGPFTTLHITTPTLPTLLYSSLHNTIPEKCTGPGIALATRNILSNHQLPCHPWTPGRHARFPEPNWLIQNHIEDFINIKQWVARPICVVPPKSPNVLNPNCNFGPGSPFSGQNSELGQSFRMDTLLDMEQFVKEEVRSRGEDSNQRMTNRALGLFLQLCLRCFV